MSKLTRLSNKNFMNDYLYKIEYVKSNTLPITITKYESKQRNWQFYLSRIALSKCLNLSGERQDISIEELEIFNNLYLKKFPHISVSISHTTDYGAAVCADSDKYLSLGIDIEKCSRSFNQKILKFYEHEFDSKYLPLELWTKKEAAFKAISPILSKLSNLDVIFVIKHIWINNDEFGIYENRKVLGNLNTFIDSSLEDDILVTIALVKKGII